MISRLPRPVTRFIFEHPRGFSLLLALLLMAFTVYFWLGIVESRRTERENEARERNLAQMAEIQLLTREIRGLLEARLAILQLELQRLADTSALQPANASANFANASAALLERHRSFHSVALLSRDLAVQQLQPAAVRETFPDPRLFQDSPRRGWIEQNASFSTPYEPSVSPLHEFLSGVKGFSIDVPIVREGRVSGYVCGNVRLSAFLHEALGGLMRSYEVRVEQDGRAFHDVPWEKVPVAGPARIFQVNLGGQHWQVQIRAPQLEPERAQFVDGYHSLMLVLGLLASAVIGNVVYLLANQINLTRRQDEEKSRLLDRARRSERQLLTFIDSANVFLLVADAQGAVQICNSTFCRGTGYTDGEMRGRIWWHFLQVDYQQVETIERIFAGRNAVENLETSIVAADRGRRIVVWNIAPSPVDDGCQFVCVGRDITERRRESERLRISQRRFQLLFEEMQEGVLVLGPDGAVTESNRQAQRILQGGTEKLQGRRLPEVLAGLGDQDGHPLAPDMNPLLEACRRQSSAGPFLLSLSPPGRPRRWIFISAAALEVNDQFLGMVVTFSDVTAIKEAEQNLARQREEFRQILENMDQGVLLTGEDLTVAAFNPQFLKIFNLPAGWMEGRPAFAEVAVHIARQADKPAEVEQLLESAARRSRPETFEVLLHEGLRAEVCTGRLQSGQRLWTFRDITQRDRIESHLRQAQKMESVGNLAGGLAHDFNNILTVVSGYLSLLADLTPPGDRRHEPLQRSQEALNRAMTLTRKLLTFSRGEVFRMGPVCLNNVLRGSLDLLRRSIPSDVEILLDLGSGEARVRADEGALEQVAVNLCLNAADAMSKGGRIVMTTRFVEVLPSRLASSAGYASPGGYICWSVSDNGVGMPPEVLPRIFEPFFSTKQNSSHSGLGLAMVYGIVRAHRGHLDVESQPDVGTTFRIYLPSTTEELPAGASRPSSAERPHDGLVGRRILLVDDEEMVVEMVGALLERKGMKVLSASNGRDALELFNKNRGAVDLVLTDLVMPGMSGAELIHQIRALQAGIPCMISSAYTVDPEAPELRGQPVDGVIIKPYEASQLFQKLQQVLDAAGRA